MILPNNKEAIIELQKLQDELVYDFNQYGLDNDEKESLNKSIYAIEKAMKLLKRFDGAVEVEWSKTAHPNNPKTHKLFAIPKENKE